ncbi:cytochrome P450, partial [Methylobacter sp. BlB1]|uniref:cytochrome P450 n=1 Tax=Methylobacter sp. BlB1 TaxID=2785914 RepID=UPI0018931503
MNTKPQIVRRTLRQYFSELGLLLDNPLSGFEVYQQRWGDVVPLPIPGLRAFQITHPEQVGVVLKIPHRDQMATKSLKDLLGKGLLTNQEDDWHWRRRIIAKPLGPKAITAFVDDMFRLTESWFIRLNPEGREVDVTPELMGLAFDILIHTVFGANIKINKDSILSLLEQYMSEFTLDNTGWRRWLPPFIVTPGRRQRRRAIAGMQDLIRTAIAQRRAAPESDDLLYRLMTARDEEGNSLNDEQLRDELLTMILAGYDTVALMIGYALWLLARHPAIQQQVHEELKAIIADGPINAETLARLPLLNAVLDESLRLFPPAYIIGREADKDLDLNGFQIKRGDQLLVPLWVVHRDPRWWQAPDAFRPERWLNGETAHLPANAFFPFGGGPR